MSTTTGTKSESTIWETVSIIVQAGLLALILRTFIFQPFSIPSGSMMPTLLVGDYIFVSKYSYGYSRHSFPFSPNLFSGRIWAGEPKRGDVIVFKKPSDNRTDYIKRLIGLPGDKVQLINSVVHINGQPLPRAQQGEFAEESNAARYSVPVFVETQKNGKSYTTLDLDPGRDNDTTRVYEVPPGHYFFMGDNRDNSQDSRFQDVGFVKAENLVGKAQIIFLSLEDGAAAWQIWRWPTDMRWGRIFQGL